jgi:glycosyltransferase involved in cell wall biosynthesis
MSEVTSSTELKREQSVSVIIPTYKRKTNILRVLDKLATQTYPASGFEVVVVIDGCEDGTREALQTLTTPFQLKVHWQNNTGLAGARNAGAAQATGDLFIFLDDDVEPTPALVAEQVKSLKEHPRAIVMGYMPVIAPEQEISSQLYAMEYNSAWEGYKGMTDPYQLLRSLWAGNLGMARATFFAVGGFDAETFRGYGCEDRDFGLRAYKVGFYGVINEQALAYHYHNHTFESILHNSYRKGFSDVRLYRKLEMPVAELWQVYYGWLSRPLRWMFALGQRSKLVGGIMDQTWRGLYRVGGTLKIRSVQFQSLRLLRYRQLVSGLVDEVGGWANFCDLKKTYQAMQSNG